MDIETTKYVVEYGDAKFVFKMGDYRDLMMIIKAQKGGAGELMEYFESRCIAIENLNIDGKPATVEDILDLPRPVVETICNAWVTQTAAAFDINMESESKNDVPGESQLGLNGS